MKAAFYERPVVDVAQDLIGCVVEHQGCAGVIVESEAYQLGIAQPTAIQQLEDDAFAGFKSGVFGQLGIKQAV